MNVTEITTNGPVMENLCEVTVSDQHDSGNLHLDNAEVEEARELGQDALLGLILDNAGSRIADILKAAVTNGTDVLLDGENVPTETLASALAGPSTPSV